MKYIIFLCAGNSPFHKIFEPLIEQLKEAINLCDVKSQVESIIIEELSEASSDRTQNYQRIFFNLHSLKTVEIDIIRADDWVFNFEQLSDQWVVENSCDWYLRFLNNAVCIDYSKKNFDYLVGKYGFGQKILSPIVSRPLSPVSSTTRLGDESKDKIFDFFFVGSLNSRRRNILEIIKSAGFSVDIAFGIFGEELYERASHAKYVLNIHYYDTGIIEVFRIVDFMSNGFLVVSESSDETDWFGYEFLKSYVQLFDISKASEDLRKIVGFSGTQRARAGISASDMSALVLKSMMRLIEKLLRTRTWLAPRGDIVEPRSEISAISFESSPPWKASSKFSIDVIIPVYKDDFLEETIQSVLSARSPFARRIFVSDNCTGESVKILCEQYPVVYYRPKYLATENLMTEISLGTGSIVHVLGADDLVYESFYQEVCDSFLSHSCGLLNRRYWACSTGSNTVSESRVIVQTRLLKGVEYIDKDIIARCISKCVNPFGGLSSVVFERAWVHEVGVQNVFSATPGRMSAALDFQIIMNLALSAHLNYIPQPLLASRVDYVSQETADEESKFSNLVFWYILTYWRGRHSGHMGILEDSPYGFESHHEPTLGLIDSLFLSGDL